MKSKFFMLGLTLLSCIHLSSMEPRKISKRMGFFDYIVEKQLSAFSSLFMDYFSEQNENRAKVASLFVFTATFLFRYFLSKSNPKRLCIDDIGYQKIDLVQKKQTCTIEVSKKPIEEINMMQLQKLPKNDELHELLTSNLYKKQILKNNPEFAKKLNLIES